MEIKQIAKDFIIDGKSLNFYLNRSKWSYKILNYFCSDSRYKFNLDYPKIDYKNRIKNNNIKPFEFKLYSYIDSEIKIIFNEHYHSNNDYFRKFLNYFENKNYDIFFNFNLKEDMITYNANIDILLSLYDEMTILINELVKYKSLYLRNMIDFELFKNIIQKYFPKIKKCYELFYKQAKYQGKILEELKKFTDNQDYYNINKNFKDKYNSLKEFWKEIKW